MRQRRWTGKYIGKNLLSQRNKDFAKLQNLFPSTEIASTDLFLQNIVTTSKIVAKVDLTQQLCFPHRLTFFTFLLLVPWSSHCHSALFVSNKGVFTQPFTWKDARRLILSQSPVVTTFSDTVTWEFAWKEQLVPYYA